MGKSYSTGSRQADMEEHVGRRSGRKKRGRPRKSDPETSLFSEEPQPKRGRRAKKAPAPTKKTSAGRTRGRPRKASVHAEVLPQSSLDDKKVKCEVCSKVFRLNTLLTVHRRVKHKLGTYHQQLHRKTRSWNLGAQVTVQVDSASGLRAYGCNRCGEMFDMWSKWMRHHSRKHVNRHRCYKCKAAFASPLDLQHHDHRKHRGKVVVKNR